METFSRLSDPHPYQSNSMSQDNEETSSTSDGCSTTDTHHRSILSDEGASYSLAATRPKKRAGRRIFKETRHPIYWGVRKRNGERWVCEVRVPNNKKSRIWLGTYPTAEMAARAHDVAALALRGKSACLNFADSAWRLPLPASSDARDIRRAASEGAEMFRIQDSHGAREKLHLRNKINQTKVNFVDEEALFDMPGLLTAMAEGLLLSPPNHMVGWRTEWDHIESNSDLSLWSF